MKKLFFTLLIIFSCCNYFAANAALVDSVEVTNQNNVLAEKQFPTNSEIEQIIGRKLSLKEKIAILINKKELKKQFEDRQLDERANKNAVLGFAFSVLGIFFLFFLIPGYILSQKALKKDKENPGSLTPSNHTLAQIGKGIAIVSAILLIFVIILLAIFISRWNVK